MIENVTGKTPDLYFGVRHADLWAAERWDIDQPPQPEPPGGCLMGPAMLAAFVFTGIASLVGMLVGWALR
jgi:hypothetical protein